jgi:hypothetical protein
LRHPRRLGWRDLILLAKQDQLLAGGETIEDQANELPDPRRRVQ